ncbi:hypothetical protein OPQ81_011000 [Rhizoctonia solani]|nr:hypothetical protein OPQ81_011000 [Rhizoctonia solani]
MHLTCRRRAKVLLALTLLAACTSTAAATTTETGTETGTSLAPVAQESNTAQENAGTTPNEHPSPEQDAKSLEAQKALADALSTIKALDALPPYAASPIDATLPAWINSIFPNPSGPVASALRIVTKLRSQQWLPSFLSSRASRDEARVRQRVSRLEALLQRSIELGNLDALYTLAHISVYPPVGMAVDARRAYDSYSRHAELTGNGTSQGMLGFFYASGYGGIVPVDQAKASLYYTFGAAGGDPASQMAMGYRHWAGIGVPEDCMAALEWYERASHQAMSHFLSGPPGGLYGHGASVASTGYNALRAPITAANARAAGETWDDVLEYYTYHAERQEPDFALKLAKIYYHGSIYPGEAVGKVQRDYWRALKYFRAVARKVWIRDNPTNPLLGRKELSKDEQGVMVHVAVACAYLGKMHLRGEGVKPDARIARMWFLRGVEFGEKESYNGLGIIFRDGLLDGKPDAKKASQYFAAAAGQDLSDAQVNYGKLYYERKDYTNAIPFFENAIRHGAPFEAYYYLADYNTQRARAGEPSSCSVAVAFHKHIAERGTWALNEGSLILPGDEDRETASAAPPESMGARMSSAWRQIKEDGELNFGGMGTGVAGVGEERMIKWSIESERGEEVAQNNLAFILDQDKSSLRKHQKPANRTSTRLALQHYTRSAAQRNVDALVKVADYHFYAVDTQVSALAMWNMGWCYEYGVGVPKDYHLAKRHYDMALATNTEAYYPATFALIRLYLKSMYYTLTGGTDKSLLLLGDEGLDGEDTWDITKRLAGAGGGSGKSTSNSKDNEKEQDEDPIKWGRQRGHELERERGEQDMDYLPEDFFDGMTTRRQNRDEDDDDDEDEFLETIFLVVLCALISGLIYLRGRYVQRQERDEQQEQDRNAMFPLGENFGVER